jgi:PTH1 family peptidyl-tRNA hydrolase
MHSLRLIAGLGNPSRKHEKDRHNVGFGFVSRLAAGQRIELKAVAKYHGLMGKLARPAGDLWLLLPQTYMNLSGKSVGALTRFYKIQPAEVLVVHDELDFPPGVAKLKLGGGVAGHNGLKDISAQLGSQGFWRLRIGIGHPGDKSLVADYVLSPPRAAERELIETALARVMEASGLLLEGELEAAMLKLHTQS